MVKIKAVFFDIGGVVAIGWKKSSRKDTTYHAAKLLKIPEEKVKEFLFSKILHKLDEGKISEFQFWETLCKKYKSPCPSKHLLKPLFQTRTMKVVPAFEKITRNLRKQGIIAGAISNAIPPHAEIGRKTGTYRFFNPVVLSCEIGVRKPKQKIFKIAAKKAGVKLGEAIFFDDHQHNVDVANKLGMSGYLYKNVRQMRSVLSKHGIRV